MDQFEIYIALIGITVIVGVLFKKTTVPVPLLLVIAGMLISLIPGLPQVQLSPALILNIFLPLLVYTASAQLSWKDVKANLRPILWLSVGHVIFIAIVVACIAHALIPTLSWPLAFLLGAIVSPPDDVAIIAIAEKLSMPTRVVTILKGESMLNDATALILFRFSLAVVLTQQFLLSHALLAFLLVIIGETVYGLVLGHLMGELRLRIQDASLQMMISILTPFLAYLPAEALGGCGVLATVVTGFVIGHRYLYRFPPEVRLTGFSLWSTITYALQSILFLLVGLDLPFTWLGISSLSWNSLALYSIGIILTVIIGRFIWIFLINYLRLAFYHRFHKTTEGPPWQFLFLISWAGMRGGISLAAALAIPLLPMSIEGANPRDLLIFLVFAVITATLLLQGLTLPWLIKTLGIGRFGMQEKYCEHLAELSARRKMASAVLKWLREYKAEAKEDISMCHKVELKIRQYRLLKNQLNESIKNHPSLPIHDEVAEYLQVNFLSEQINAIERDELLKLWREDKISHAVRTRLLEQLDHGHKRIAG